MGSEQARRAAAPLPRRLARRTRIRLQGRHRFRGGAAADDPVVSRGAPGGRQARRCVGLGLGDSTAVFLTWLSFGPLRATAAPPARMRLMNWCCVMGEGGGEI